MSKTLEAGRYKIRIIAVDGRNEEFPCEGELELSSGKNNHSIKGHLSEGPIVEGSWTEESSEIKFVLLYNGSVPFEYRVDLITQRGSWKLHRESSGQSLNLDEYGVLEGLEWECIETAADNVQQDLAALPGNNACHVEHVSSVCVPCSMCGNNTTSSRLAFFEMKVPNFGTAELMSFSCGDLRCSYRVNQLRTTEPAKPYGVTLTLDLVVSSLDNAVVLTDSAQLKCQAFQLEASVGVGRYTTAEGLLRGVASSLRNASIAATTDDNNADVNDFSQRVDTLLEGIRSGQKEIIPLTLQIDDPLGLSYMEGAAMEKWERTPEQEEELGLLAAPTTPDLIQNLKSTGSSNPEETSKLMKACEAMAAEFTREYHGDDNELEATPKEEEEDDDDALVSGFAGCD